MTTTQRPPIALVQRLIFHLGNDKRTALDQDDADAVESCTVSIRQLEGIVRSLRADEYIERRRRRAETRRVTEINQGNRRLQNRLAADGHFVTLPKAA